MKHSLGLRLIIFSSFNLIICQNLDAQIIPDNTLGNESSIVTPSNGQINIEGGAIRTNNLFHSFQEFNINQGQSAYFVNPNGVTNIFSRITGNTPSQILGTLGVLGNANLFFLNPNGILFGVNSRLDIQGSFFATTAESFIFKNGQEFSAVNPKLPPLLTIQVQQPIGIKFGNNPATIINQSVATNEADAIVGLELPLGQNLTFLGGKIELDGGQITTVGGDVQLGSIAESTIVLINEQGNLVLAEGVKRDNILLSNNADIEVANEGSITLNGRNIELTHSSSLSAGIEDDVSLTNTSAGNINIQATENVIIDESVISDIIFGEGKAGDIIIDANNNIVLIDSFMATTVGTRRFNAKGEGGDIILKGNSILFQDGSQLLSGIFLGSEGIAGNVIVMATETLSFEGVSPSGFRSAIFTDVETDVMGDAGNIILTANAISLKDQATLISINSGVGQGGNINLQTTTLQLNDSQIVTNTFGIGNAGNIFIEVTKTIKLNNESQIEASTVGMGNGGLINISADQLITLAESSQILGNVREEARGNGGRITITTPRLTLKEKSQVSVSTEGFGQAGTLNLNIQDRLSLIGQETGLFANTTNNAIGDGGSIFLTGNQVNLENGARITVDSQGTGIGGNIVADVNNITLDNAIISAENTSNTGGDINLQVQGLLLLRNGSQLSTTAGTAQAAGDGGNIILDTNFITAIAKENSDITANAFLGNGGKISITTNGLFGLEFREQLTPLSEITATSTFGLAGVVEINNPNADLTQGFVKLTETPEEIEFVEGCQASKDQENLAFFEVGKGGLLITPEDPLNGGAIITPWIPLVKEMKINKNAVLFFHKTRNDRQFQISDLFKNPCLFRHRQGYVIKKLTNIKVSQTYLK